MSLTNFIQSNVRRLDPGSFALVMATGIVSIDASQHGMPMLALMLFALNLTAYPANACWSCTGWHGPSR